MTAGRVLLLLGPSTGGIRQHVAVLAEQLPAHGWSVATAGPPGVLHGLGTLDHEISPAGRLTRGPTPRSVWRAVRAIRSAAREVDVVHAHGLTVGWLAVAARTKRPIVVTVHNVVLDPPAGSGAVARSKARVLRAVEGALPARVAAVIAVSDGIAARFGSVRGGSRVSVVPPVGPDPRPDRSRAEVRAGLGAGDDRALVVTVARLHPQKDLPTLLRAAARLRERPDHPLVAVIGDGPDRAELARAAQRDGLDDTLVLAGPSPNAANELAAADVVVCSSRWESGPLAVAEALRLERPVVSTPVGFVPALLGADEGGWLVPVGDDAAMAAAIGAALDDPAAARERALRGRAAAEELLGRDRLVAAVADVYRAVLQPGAVRS